MVDKKKVKKQELPILPDAEFNKVWAKEKNYKFMKRLSDPRFGDVNIVTNKQSGEVLMVKEKMATSKKEASNDIRNLKSRLLLNHPNLLKMVNYSTSVKKNLCSTHYLSRGFYKFPRSDMSKELTNSKKNLTEFSSNQLRELGQDSLNGLGHLHQRNLNHGDVRPQFIGYDKKINNYALLDRFKDPSPMEKAQINNLIGKKKLFMSPQLYKKLQGKQKGVNVNAQKNDIYALGMSILSLGTQDSVQDCYLPNGEMNKEKLNQHLNDFDNKYQSTDPSMVGMLHSMLQEDEGLRPTVAQMQGLVPRPNQERMVQNAPPLNYVHQTPVTSIIHSNNDFFGNSKTIVHAEPQKEMTYIVENEVQANPITYQQPTETKIVYSDVNTTMKTTEEPIRTYLDYSHTFNKAPNYVQNQPTTTYVQAPPTTTYVQNQPPTTYVQNQPPTTYVQNQPPTTYVQAQPTTTYVQAPPTTYTTTYVQGQPTSYVQNQPTTTYVNNPNPPVYTTTYVNQQKEYTPVEQNVENTPQQEVEDSDKKVVKENEVVPNTIGLVDNPQTRVYTTTEYNQKYILNDNQNYAYTNTQPTTYTYQQPTTTYVQNTPNKLNTENIPPTIGLVDKETTNVVYENPPVQYQYAPQTYTYTQNQDNVKRIYTQPITTTVNQQPTEYRNVVYNNGQKVEVRRGSYIPPDQQTQEVTEVKKKYVLQENGTVIEVDPNTQMETEQIRVQKSE